MPYPRPVHALITPLQSYYDDHLNDVDIAARWSKLHHVPFSNLQHWAVQIGNVVYEVTRRGTSRGEHAKYRKIAAHDWWFETNRANLEVRFLGYTQEQHVALDDLGLDIWILIMKQQYCAFTTNCRTFAAVFHAVAVDTALLQSSTWKAKVRKLPMALNPFVGIAEKAKRVKAMALASRKMARQWLNSHRAVRDEQYSPLEKHPRIPCQPNTRWRAALQDEWKNSSASRARLSDVVRAVDQKRTSAWQLWPIWIRSFIQSEWLRLVVSDSDMTQRLCEDKQSITLM